MFLKYFFTISNQLWNLSGGHVARGVLANLIWIGLIFSKYFLNVVKIFPQCVQNISSMFLKYFFTISYLWWNLSGGQVARGVMANLIGGRRGVCQPGAISQTPPS